MNQVDQLLSDEVFRGEVESLVASQLQYNGEDNTEQFVSFSKKNRRGPISIISDIHGSQTSNYRKGEKLQRCKLAACYRLADLNGWSNEISGFISVRLESEVDHILVKPYGLSCEEVTAASLVKINLSGNVVDFEDTSFPVSDDVISFHLAEYAARPSVNCIFTLVSPSVVSVSAMKCGLLPVCHEAMALGKIGYKDYTGYLSGSAESDRLMDSESNNKILFQRNYGVVIFGETIEETFRMADNVTTAVAVQVNLIPFGINNISLPSEEIQKNIFKSERSVPPGVDGTKRWRYGEVEFEALMRQLDAAGYCTGHVYRDPVIQQPTNRSCSVSDVLTSSIGSEDKENSIVNGLLIPNLLQKKALDPASTISPNVYYKKELSERNYSSGFRKITRWKSESSMSSRLGKPKAVDIVPANVNKFAPQGKNPRELKEKVQEIRKEYYEDVISAGPQSTVLEGMTWEEARRIKDGQGISGFDNVLVSSASRGIIQRDHQQKALFYKNYTLGNPFENVTENELENYRREIERKNRKPGIESLNNNETEASMNFYNKELSYGEVTPPIDQMEPLVVESSNGSVGGRLILSSKQQANSATTEKDQSDKPIKDVGEREVLQRTQSAHYPKKNQELIKELQQKSSSMKRGDSANILSFGNQSSKENSLSRDSTLSKDKKKKRGFRFPSFSRKKKDAVV